MDVLDRLLRKSLHRLGIGSWIEDCAFSVTISTNARAPVFDNIPFGVECVRLLTPVCRRTRARLYAYCLMPDHACLLIGVLRKGSLATTVTAWKSVCQQARRQKGPWAPFWQRGYSDRALPSPEAIRLAIRYVLEKPVRAGLVADYRDYPLCGPPDALADPGR